MRILLVNQFVPPERAPTARLLGDLADHLRSRGHEVQLIGAGARYGHSTPGLATRLMRDLRANAVLAWKTLTAGRADWILCLSDPPGLPFTAAVVAKLKRTRLAHWAMDVYPDVAVALGAIPAGAPARIVRAAMRTGYRAADLLTALDGDMAGRISAAPGKDIQICAPWPPLLPASRSPCNALADLRNRYPGARVWLYSGNLGRAHEYEGLLRAQAILESEGTPWRLVFQGGGASREPAMALAGELGLRQCHWLPYAEDREFLDSLLSADVLVATQKESMAGLIWPSKLALMLLVEKPLAWVGEVTGGIASGLRPAQPGAGIFSPAAHADLAAWLRGLPPSPDRIAIEEIERRVSSVRADGLRLWEQWLQLRE